MTFQHAAMDVLVAAVIAQGYWIRSLLAKLRTAIGESVDLVGQKAVAQTNNLHLAHKVDDLDARLTEALRLAEYWHGHARQWEQEVLKIAGGMK